jgi:hypothetical protein
MPLSAPGSQAPARAELDRISSPISVASMRNVDDADNDSFVENLVDHPESASPRRVPPLQLTAKWFADAMRILRERTSNELPTCDGDCFG